MSTATIRLATRNDIDAMHRLVRLLCAYEKEDPDKRVRCTRDELERGFDAQHFRAFVAEADNDNIVGMALFYHRFSTWDGLTIHLEDLIVAKEHRSQGIGKRLLTAVVDIGVQENVRRVEWVVLAWNKKAIDFYESLGAAILQDWQTVQLHRDSMDVLVQNS
jgi:ribosomal protein S18 acetylase RimI-like enzyme